MTKTQRVYNIKNSHIDLYEYTKLNKVLQKIIRLKI